MGAKEQFLRAEGLERLPGLAGAAHLWASREPRWLPKPPTCPNTGLKVYYPLDLASAMPILALIQAVGSAHAVLDTCAAPGGKFLVLAGFFQSSKLVAVEQDAFRLSRLKQNLRLYLPRGRDLPPTLAHLFSLCQSSSLVIQTSPRPHAPTVLRGDFTQLPLPHAFDAVLVDAPCSSDRERLLRAQRRGQAAPWAARRAEANAVRQRRLLAAALRATEGHVVYATCALSSIENDLVVEQVLGGAALVSEPLEVEGLEVEKTRLGYQVLPDRPGNWGPLYWSTLRSGKRAS